MTLQPSFMLILAPILASIEYVAEETKVNGLLKRALAHIELGRPLLEYALIKLEESNISDTSPLSRLLTDAPIQEEWAIELRSSDYSTLHSHSLVSIWGVLESCLENLVVTILMNDADIFQKLTSSGLKIDPSKIASGINEEDARALYQKIENHVRVKGNIVLTYEAVLSLFDLSAACLQHTESLLSANALRNCIMHRGGIIDKKAINQAPELSLWLGKKYNLTSDDYLKYYDAVTAWLSSLLDSAIKSKYVVNNSL